MSVWPARSRTPAPLPAWLALELQRTHHLPAAHVPAPRPVPSRARQAVLVARGTKNPVVAVLTTVLAEIAIVPTPPKAPGSPRSSTAPPTPSAASSPRDTSLLSTRRTLDGSRSPCPPRAGLPCPGHRPQWHDCRSPPSSERREPPVTSPAGGERNMLFDFDPQALAEQIMAKAAPVLPPQRTNTVRTAADSPIDSDCPRPARRLPDRLRQRQAVRQALPGRLPPRPRPGLVPVGHHPLAGRRGRLRPVGRR